MGGETGKLDAVVRATSGDECAASADEISTLYSKSFTRGSETTRAALTLFFSRSAVVVANELFASLALDDFLAAVVTRWADVVTTMRLARGRLDREEGRLDEIVCTMHAAFRRGFFVLLNGHDGLLTNQINKFVKRY
jgi:hypothetical protein